MNECVYVQCVFVRDVQCGKCVFFFNSPICVVLLAWRNSRWTIHSALLWYGRWCKIKKKKRQKRTQRQKQNVRTLTVWPVQKEKLSWFYPHTSNIDCSLLASVSFTLPPQINAIHNQYSSTPKRLKTIYPWWFCRVRVRRCQVKMMIKKKSAAAPADLRFTEIEYWNLIATNQRFSALGGWQ